MATYPGPGGHGPVQDTAPARTDHDDPETPDSPGAAEVLRQIEPLITQAPWFSRLGALLSDEERGLAADYVQALGFPEIGIGAVEDWTDAALIAANPGIDTFAWEAEEQLRLAERDAAREALSAPGLSALLAMVEGLAANIVFARAATAAEAAGMDDPELIEAAGAHAVQACHQAALALANEAAPTHPFILKFRLFAAGRWPLGITGATFNLF